MSGRAGALLVAGTTSDAGKSILTAGLCRWLARQGIRVAPFKAQNMSLNSMVTADGGEIGRAQAMQAAAAGIVPEAVMNPVLLKPGGDRTSHVVVLGQPSGEVGGGNYRRRTSDLMQIALDSLADLRSRFDVVICEGAGSPAEVNLRAGDIANMGLARAADLPVLLVGDIDRGGIFAHFAGTLGVLDAADQRHIAGYVVNKFRGDLGLLEPGLDWLTRATGRPVFGVLPWLTGLWLDVEDSLDLASRPSVIVEPVGAEVLQVAVVRLPRMSNVTDLDPLSAEPGVTVRLIEWPQEMTGADLVVVPGTRSTVSDLQWLRDRGFVSALQERAAASRPILGICGGLQVLGSTVSDGVESRTESTAGLGLLPVRTVFAESKVLDLQESTWRGERVRGYRIHHGRPQVDLDAADEQFLDGCRVGAVWGTSWHGAFESDGFRRLFLTMVAADSERNWRPGEVSFEQVRQRRLDALGDLVEEHLDTKALLEVIEKGVPANLPAVNLVLG
jgi:adenosylcobyric acid synthase